MRRSFLLFSLFFALGYGLFFAGVWRITDGFSVAKIESDLPFNPQWEVAQLTPVTEILKQKFFYMEKGSQCYVFESEDGEYILKFFRHSRYRLPKLATQWSLPSFLQQMQNKRSSEKEKRLEALFSSCKIAFEELHEETGLLFCHLNKTTHLNQTTVIYDRLKRPYYLNMDRYEFLIQRRGEQIYPYLTRLMKEGREGEAKEALGNLARLILHRLELEISDGDAVIHKNSGFRNGEAMFLDIGQFSHKEIPNKRRETEKIARRLESWLESKDEMLANHFKEALYRGQK